MLFEVQKNYGLVVHETLRESRYLKAGAPTRCRKCKKPFGGACIREHNRYYCSEICAQVELEIDFDKVADLSATSRNGSRSRD